MPLGWALSLYRIALFWVRNGLPYFEPYQITAIQYFQSKLSDFLFFVIDFLALAVLDKAVSMRKWILVWTVDEWYA